jgi:hypothetical protein
MTIPRKVFMITYELPMPASAHQLLADELMEFPHWCNLMPGVWMVETEGLHGGMISDRLKGIIPSHLSYFVIEVNRDYQGRITYDSRQWIDHHMLGYEEPVTMNS